MADVNKDIDFLDRLVDNLDEQGYFGDVLTPLLATVESIAVMPMPSNNYDHYFDGSYRQMYSFQILAKHEEQMVAYNTMIQITNHLKNVKDIPSNNGSYIFEEANVTTDPNGIGKDEKYHIFVGQYNAALFIEA